MPQTYLIHTPSSFCFRLTIPVDLHPAIGKRELRWSLNTGAVGIARQKARLLAGNLQHLFRQLREKRYTVTELTTENIQQIIENFMTQAILMAQQEIFDISIQRSQGIYSDKYATEAAKSPILAPSATPEPKSATPPGLPAIDMRAAVEEWFKENTDAGNWRCRSIKEYRTTMNRIVEFFGDDRPPDSIMPVDMKAYTGDYLF